MGRIYEKLKGTATIEICGSLPESFLNACAVEGIEIWKLKCIDSCTVQMLIYEKNLLIAETIAAKCMCSIKTVEVEGGSRNKSFLINRKWLFIFVAVSAVILMLSSLFIWNIEVYGNEKLSDGEILRQLSECGVREGCFWPQISPELVRSQMLTKLSDLSWMTVNISGSQATVIVLEREEKPEIYSESEPSNIIAAENGIIKNIKVSNGSALVSKGQTVTKGQLLVSAAMESINGEARYVCSRASIMADSSREIRMVYPIKMREKKSEALSQMRFALKFGKKRINLYLNSRNDIDECDKIITEYKLGFDGLFVLPISLVTEELTAHIKAEKDFDISELICAQRLEELSERIDGKIEHSSITSYTKDGLCYVNLYAQGFEDIAKSVKIQ